MRVLNVNVILDPECGGGTAERTLQISRFMAKKGADCSVLTMNTGRLDKVTARLGGARLIALPCLSNRFFLPGLQVGQIWEHVRSADIIHIMNHWSLLNMLVGMAARRLGKPYAVCPAGALPAFGRSKMLKFFYNLFVGRQLIQKADGQVAISRNEIPFFQQYGVEPDRVTIIPNGIDPKDFEAVDDTGFRDRHGLSDAPFILFVGRLDHIKGPDLLLRAFIHARDALQQYHLVFVGPDSGMQVNLEKLKHDSGVAERIHFLGYLGGREKSEAYHAATLLVIPSRQEAMSIVALEAGACGTPVLLTDQCGFDEIEESGGGRVVSASVSGLEDGLVVMCRDFERLKAMGEIFQIHVLARYTWDAVVEKYIRLYEQILANRRGI